jgi:hypothetical protein
MKVKTKSIIALMIALFAVMLIGATTVNAESNSVIDNALKNIPQENGIYIIDTYHELGDNNFDVYKVTINKLNNAFNDSSITITESDKDCGGGSVPSEGDTMFTSGSIPKYYDIYINNEYYTTIQCGAKIHQKITVPSNANLEEYATSKIVEYLKIWSEDLTGIEGQNVNITFKKLEKVSGDNYNVYYTLTNGTEKSENILIQQVKPTTEPISKEDTTTGIKLETTTAVVPSNTILSSVTVTEQKTLDTVNKALKDITIKYKVYDINLLKDGAKIQPNGKVKVSIPIPSDYNKSRLEVYRIDDNGTKTKYNVTVNGEYASFETDHFSIYVLAEKKEETAPSTPTVNKGEKDETPKTGIQDITYIITAVVIISAVGIIATIKRKQSKH